MRLVVVIATALLAGCQTQTVQEMSFSERSDLALEVVQRCADQGYGDGHPLQRACIEHEANREIVTRNQSRQRQERARIAFAQSLGNYGQSLQQQSANQINCTSTPGMNGVVQTSCY